MAPLSNICKNIFLNSIVQRNRLLSYRLVSTSGKKEDAAGGAASSKEYDPQEAVYRKVPDFTKPLDNKNWISYGFDYEDKGRDKFRLHFSYFTFISLFLCGISFIYKYYPDRDRRDWCRREAFIRLHEREQLGLEPIDKNYVDPSKVILPPDEELSEEDIVI